MANEVRSAPVAVNPTAIIQLTLLLIGALPVMSGAVIAPALPAIGAQFSGEPYAELLVRLLLTAPALAIVLSAPLAGYVLDRCSKPRVLLVALIGFVIFGGAGLVLNTLETLLLSRLALGVAVAFVMGAVTALAGDLFTSRARAGFLGRQNSVGSMAGMAFLLSGGVLAGLSWRAPFLVYIGALPLVWLLWRFVPSQPAPVAQSTSEHEGKEAVSWWPLIGVYSLATLCMLSFYVLPTQGPFLIAAIYEGPAVVTGAALAATTLGAIPTSLAYGRLRKRLTGSIIFILGFFLYGAGLMMQGMAESIATVFVAMLVSGTGFGLIMPNLSNTLLAIAPPQLRGRLSGGLMSCIFLGQFLSPVFSQPLMASQGYAKGFLLIGVSLVVVSLSFLIVKRRIWEPSSFSK